MKAPPGPNSLVAPDPLQNVLSRLEGVRNYGKEYEARCPAHDDQHTSLSVSLGDDRRVLIHCHAGCTTEAICKALGLSLSDLFAPDSNSNGRARLVVAYDYRHANEALLYQVDRFEPKAFGQRRPDGKGGWIWKLGTTPRILYRLRELIAAPQDAWVYVVEGEKDVNNLAQRGAFATTCPQGAGKWAKLSDDSALEGRRVGIIADKDARPSPRRRRRTAFARPGRRPAGSRASRAGQRRQRLVGRGRDG